MSRKFLLCFHDFSVWNFRTSLPILEDLKDLAGAPFSVLVIPDTENATPEAIDGFRGVLRKLKSEGFELALHGFKHKAEFSQGRSYAGLVGMNLTGGESEFAGLCEYESSRLLQAALEAWKNLLAAGASSCRKNVVRRPLFADNCRRYPLCVASGELCRNSEGNRKGSHCLCCLYHETTSGFASSCGPSCGLSSTARCCSRYDTRGAEQQAKASPL